MLSKNLKTDYTSSRTDYNSSKIVPAAKIKVIGVGGCGGNAVRRMIEAGLEGVEFWAMNTDLQVLKQIHADGVIQLGANITRGLGAGMSSEVGRQSAEESVNEIEASLTGADMVFITCGMGGGTGTGAGPVVAEVAKRLGILTIGVVTKPFDFEGQKRKQIAEEGIERLKANADAVIVVPNQRLLQIVDKRTSVHDAFRISDDVLRQAVQGISDLINMPGEVNVDFADVRAIMSNAGTALMGMGKASGGGEEKARQAAMMAIDSPLLELSIDGARGVLFNVQGGKSMSMFEINEAASIINQHVDPEAKIIFGTSIDPNINDEIRITVIATGFTKEKEELPNYFGATSGGRKPQAYQSPNFSPNKPPEQQYHRPEYNQPSNNPQQNYSYPSQPTQSNNPSNHHDQSGSGYNGVNVNNYNRPTNNQPQSQQPPAKNNYDEQLDIPAFLRKKMGYKDDE
jgi:cell division protein FtsZ